MFGQPSDLFALLANKMKEIGVHEFIVPPSNSPDIKDKTFPLDVIFSVQITYYLALLSHVQRPLIGRRRWALQRPAPGRGTALRPTQMCSIPICTILHMMFLLPCRWTRSVTELRYVSL